MKILFYSPVSLRYGAGAERWQMRVASALKNKYGHEVTVVACRQGKNNLSTAEITKQLGGVKYLELPVRLGGGMIFLTQESRRRLEELCRETEVVVYVFGFVGHDLLLRRLAKRFGFSLYVGLHAPIFTAGRLHNLYVRTVSRWWGLKGLAGYLVFNDDQKKLLERWGANRITSIAGGLDLERYAKSSPRRVGDKLRFIFVGRLGLDKSIDLLIQVIERLAAEGEKSARFCFIGTGPMTAEVEKLAQKLPEMVEDVGFIPDTLPKLRESDVALLPSRQETFGFAMVEALAAGLPVIVSDNEGSRLAIVEGKSGWYVKPLTADALYTKIKELIGWWRKDHQVFAQYATACRQAAAPFSAVAVAQKLDKLFKEAGKR